MFLLIPGVGADYSPGHYFRQSSEGQPKNAMPRITYSYFHRNTLSVKRGKR